jgi:hypothetical protein
MAIKAVLRWCGGDHKEAGKPVSDKKGAAQAQDFSKSHTPRLPGDAPCTTSLFPLLRNKTLRI